jgi:cobalt/nickel transport system ATP-binding protein
VIVATHQLDFAWEVGDRAVLLSGGRVVADGPVATILGDRALLEANRLRLPYRLRSPRGSGEGAGARD